jgi:hypothetical protein
MVAKLQILPEQLRATMQVVYELACREVVAPAEILRALGYAESNANACQWWDAAKQAPATRHLSSADRARLVAKLAQAAKPVLHRR